MDLERFAAEVMKSGGLGLFAFAVWAELRALRRDLTAYIFKRGEE